MNLNIRAAVAFGLLAATGVASALPMAGITANNQLAFFDSSSPQLVPVIVNITGLQAGETLLGIDTRPATGALFALGSTGRIYSIATTGAATQVGAAANIPIVAGANYAFDFNPVPGAIRIINDADTSLRASAADGTLLGTDTSLTPAGDKVAVAYDRPDQDAATLTTLFAIDSTTNSLSRIGGVDGTPSPNAGAVTEIGPLGVDATPAAGFDIAVGGEASAVFTSGLYRINLTTGAASFVGPIGGGLVLTDVTYARFVPNLNAGQVIPTLSSTTLAALAGALGLLGLVVLRRRA